MAERTQPIKGPHPATVGLIFLAVAFVTILLLSLYYYFFNKIRAQTRLEQRVAKREQDFDRGTMDDEDLEIQEVPLDDLKVTESIDTQIILQQFYWDNNLGDVLR